MCHTCRSQDSSREWFGKWYCWECWNIVFDLYWLTKKEKEAQNVGKIQPIERSDNSLRDEPGGDYCGNGHA